MKSILTYKGYHAKIEFDSESQVLYGRIDGIRDLVNFQSDSAKNIEQEFHQAVDDYLAFCEEIGQKPDKEFSGTLNIRISPEIHRKLNRLAQEENVSLNAVIAEACKEYTYTHS